jgi:hypothetical protein
MSCFIFLEIRPLPLPSPTSIPLRGLSPKGERKRETVFERVIVFSVEEVINKSLCL